jgi:hypothetical protein
MVADLWIDSENIFQNIDTWESLLFDSRDLHLRPLLMSRQDRHFLSDLPDKVTIFRGCHECNAEGFSWTIDRDIAVKLGKRFRSECTVLKGICDKDHIVAYFSSRGESEIVIHHLDVEIVEEEEI